MLTYEIRDDELRFIWPDDETKLGYRSSRLPVPSCVDRDALVHIAEGLKSLCLSNAKTSYTGHFRAAKYVFKHARKDSRPFPPKPENWENFLLSHYGSHLGNVKLKYKTRIDHWSGVAFLYRKLQRSGLIPQDVYIPDESLSDNATSESDVNNPLGFQRSKAPIPTTIDYLLPKKYLIEDGLSLNDDEYLLNLKKTLELRADTVVDCCVEYWKQMLRCHEKGKLLIESISVQEIEKVISTNDFYKNGHHLADPRSETGIQWFLAVAHYYLNFTDELSTLNFKELKKLPFFRRVISNATTRPIITAQLWKVAGGDCVKNSIVNETFNRLLGNLSPRDCAVACVIIISENPTFNPSALVNVRLYTQHGKFFLRGNSDTKRITLSVSKPRATDRKVSCLPLLSAQVVNDVIRCTTIARKRLLDQKRSGWRKLFLISTRNQIGSNTDFNKSLAIYPGLSLYDIYKSKFEEVGISCWR